jgi:hypothetical protein
MTFTVSGDSRHTYVSDESGRIVATCPTLDDAEWLAKMLNAAPDAGWQLNEAVSLLREARPHLRGGVGAVEVTMLGEEIDEGLPAMQAALEAIAAAVKR